MANNIIGTVGVGAQSVKPDWNQNDPNAKDYIKNRPGGYVIPPSVEITWDGDMSGKETVDAGYGLTLVKIADEAPSIGEFAVESDVNPKTKRMASGSSYAAAITVDLGYDDGGSETASTELELYEDDGYWIGFSGRVIVIGVKADSTDIDPNGDGSSVFTLSKGLWVSVYEEVGK